MFEAILTFNSISIPLCVNPTGPEQVNGGGWMWSGVGYDDIAGDIAVSTPKLGGDGDVILM